MRKSIVLKGLYLKNFKGIKELDIDFGKVTNIFGDNGTGKTTVFDAFTWLLFDKDSQDRSKFDVQPLDGNNNVIHMLETEVTAGIEIDGVKTILKKVLTEKWVKPKGKPESELKGVTTTYYINDVPKKQKEYKEAINNFIQEDIFKLLTNPMYFSTNLKWQDRKNVLMELIDEVTDNVVINYKEELKPLEELLNNKNIDDLKKSIAASKKKLVKDKESIPPRVDECNRSLRNDIDFSLQETNKKNLSDNIKVLDEQILDNSKVDDEILEKRKKLYDLKANLNSLEFKLNSKAQEPLKELKQKKNKLEQNNHSIGLKADRIKNGLKLNEDNISILETSIADLKKQWYEVNAKTLEFTENEFICPTCKREFEAADIEAKKQEMTENFNQGKSNKLKKINDEGQFKTNNLNTLKQKVEQLKNEYDTYLKQLFELSEEKKVLDKQILEFKPNLDFSNNQEYQELKNEISDIEAELNKPSDTSSIVEELKHKKSNLDIELDGINNLLSYKEQNAKLETRIAELQVKEKTLAQQIADLEKQEFLCDEFVKTKVELLESSINSKFKYVKFRFFKQQVNGGIDEDCEPIVNGVPFNTNLNSASKVNAGLDIINTLSQHYGIKAPIFVDNKESVTELIDTDSQVISLVVSENDKKLRVESEEI
ncbi:AAA family ATPase [Clostridium felsineum]|uniref:AAA family ATPase n=1 Tax=Clostridium felsineum TaxID=36839 RepID=UPI00214DDCC9|nr:AAA family ATPase [Clostridium felsineum]MCR3760383.1 AAA family ATPase [Clostridium felsineum]